MTFKFLSAREPNHLVEVSIKLNLPLNSRQSIINYVFIINYLYLVLLVLGENLHNERAKEKRNRLFRGLG